MSLCNHTQFSRDSYNDGVDCVQYIYIYIYKYIYIYGGIQSAMNFCGYVNLSEAILTKIKTTDPKNFRFDKKSTKTTSSNIK